MNTAKIYHDLDGNERTIHQMVKLEPQWAASRIQQAEKYEEESKWQPIDTVEKTGFYIWLADSTNMRLGFWALDTVDGSGFWADLAKAESTGPRGLHFTPTHWKPLPKPPTE